MRIDFPAFRILGRGAFWTAIWTDINDYDFWGLAAQVSYYFLLAFFPFLLFLSAFIGFIPVDPNVWGKFLAELNAFLPESTYDNVVTEIVLPLARSQSTGILSVGLFLTLLIASLAFTGIIRPLSRVYDVEDTRSYVRKFFLSMGMTILVCLFIVLSAFLLVWGDWLIDLLVESSGIRVLYTVIRWILVFVLLNIGIHTVYYALPQPQVYWRIFSPGSVVATLGWIIGSQGFRLYVNTFGMYQMFYGSLGAVIVLIVWFYLSSLALLVGGRIDSRIHGIQQSPLVSW